MPLIMQYKTGTGAPPSGGGVSTPDCTAPHFLDNTYWQNGNDCAWTGTYWIHGVTYIDARQDAIGTWANGYRPSTIELGLYRNTSGISGPDAWEIEIEDTSGASISGQVGVGGTAGKPANTFYTVSIPLTFTTFDIRSISSANYLYNAGCQIRCIKFT
jgi:hypothetical protein